MKGRRNLTTILQVVAVAALLAVIFLIFSNRRSDKPALQTEEARNTVLLDKGWQFHKGDSCEVWEDVTVPHDWAIYGPFSRDNDLQTVAVIQNGEETATVKTGRTGGLPYVGTGWYRRTLNVTPGKKATLVFDGAMSEARVYVNGQEVIFWPYGYNSFYCDITPFLNPNGQDNELRVRLENRPQSSRWYPGAGLYRNVWLIETGKVHIPVWGTYITSDINPSGQKATVNIRTEIEGITDGTVALLTEIRDAAGGIVTSIESLTDASSAIAQGGVAVLDQKVTVENPSLWSPENPTLYTAFSRVYTVNASGERELSDTYVTPFGIRSIEVQPETGFYLNGVNRKFKGVCLHHDLGPLGAAVNESAIRHQLTMLKDMGCDAIRTTHNMPAPELIRLCDEMGFMVVIENFDEWDVAKCLNGYHRFFDEWAERDMINMLRHYRNNPSVVMWSVGNEVPTQWSEDGYKVATFLQDICHREDPSRPVTCGMDQIDAVLHNGFGAVFDVPGFNYRVHRYEEGYGKLPQKVLLGSETSSTVSSRGVYKFPAEKKADALYGDHQSSSYDLEYCSWSNIPDEDLAMAQDHPWAMGQFVWTGFDYLGEPSPYDTDAWPNHSSMFGIIDLASIPKDRYWLYRSIWNTDSPTLHILPHWNWEGREGEITPVFVYTSYPKAELFLNGKSMGIREKSMEGDQPLQRFRLMWNDIRYEPGELTAVAYDSEGNEAMRETVRTAGEPYAIELVPDRETITADGKDLLYVTVRIVDADGNLCPTYNGKVKFSVSGAGTFRAAANGDPTSLELFHEPEMSAFGGMLTAIVQSSEKAGRITLTASADGLADGVLRTRAVSQEQ